MGLVLAETTKATTKAGRLVQVSALGHVAQHSIAALGHRQIEVLLLRYGQAPGWFQLLRGKYGKIPGKIPDTLW
jgi:hypothetical protein